MYEAPKLSTLVDDFRTLQIDTLQWNVTGTPYVVPTDSATYMTGLIIRANDVVSSANTTGAKRLDMWDSEIVWVIGKWALPTLVTLSVLQSGGQYGYRFEYLNGVLTVKSVEAGVTYTGAAFLTGTGATVNWGQTLKYMRIAHNASTGRVEFYAGTNPDGSDQRLMTSDLGSGAKGTLTPTQAQIDNVTVSMSVAASATTSTYVRAINAPAGGLPRSTEFPGAYYYRDFNSWNGYVGTGRFNGTNGVMSHELRTLAVRNSTSVEVNDISPVQRTLQITGDGGPNGVGGALGRTALRTGFPSGIQNVSYEVDMAANTLANTNSYVGLFWRNSGIGGNLTSSSANRYQLNIFSDRINLDVWFNDINFLDNYGTAGTDYKTLVSIPLTTNLNQTYNWRINHFEDRVIVQRDGVEVLNYTDILNYLAQAGHIGFDVGNTGASSGLSKLSVFRVKVLPSYDDLSFSAGVAMQDRGLGAHVTTGIRNGTKVSMSSDPSLLSGMESALGVPLKVAYHFSNTAAGGTNSAPVDTALIQSAIQHAREGRTNVIAINAIRPQLSQLSPTVSAGFQTDLKAWSDALNSIPGTVHVAVLPFPDLNTPWSPYAHDQQLNVSASSTLTTITQNTVALTVNALAGQIVRFQNGSQMYWSTITSNTSNTITFTSVGVIPNSSGNVWVGTATNRLKSAAEYITAYRAIVTYMKSVGCRASFVYALNWAPDIATLVSGSQTTAYSNVFADTYPGDDYVDAFIIRAINNGVTDLRLGYGSVMWRPLSKMLSGENPAPIDYTFPPSASSAPYGKFSTRPGNKKIFLLTGSAETHSKFNDNSDGYFGSPASTAIYSPTNDAYDEVQSSTYWNPANLSEYNPRNSPVIQPGLSVASGGFVRWASMPWTSTARISTTVYFRVPTLGVATTSSMIAMIGNLPGVPYLGMKVNQNTGQLSLITVSVGLTGTPTGVFIQAGVWYRLELNGTTQTGVYTVNVIKMNGPNNDRPDAATIYTTSGTMGSISATGVRFGSMPALDTFTINGLQIQNPRVSWDVFTSTYSKARWLRDALNTRAFPAISNMILFSADVANDVPLLTPTGNQSIWPMYYASNGVDTRLDSSNYTWNQVKSELNVPNPERVHTAPQLKPAGYSSTATVGNLEYMYLQEAGHVPLYLTPRLGGILLRDFNLGQASVRQASEDRPNADGVTDYSRWLGSKGVSLSFVAFDDPSGSAAFYSDVLATWSNPRRRPQLVYKFKDGEERFINLRPEANDSAWTVDGVRSGFKEVVLGFVAIDGKDFSTSVNTVLMRRGIMTQVTTEGTAATPAKIRVYGGATGCINPTIILQSEEEVRGAAVARVSLGNNVSSICVPANQFIEFDMATRTVQLNGLAGEGYSYLKYLNDRQWFYLENFYNTLYLDTDDSNGYAAVMHRDAYL